MPGKIETKYEIHLGDCLDILPTLDESSVDSIVTDPPYGLSFMGKGWDSVVPSADVWRECLRVLKPGGHMLCFAGTRTQHRMATAIEAAGFEIRDMIAWVYGSGFPKSLNVSKAIEKAAGEQKWDGWGTALKPAFEPVTVARKPFGGTVAANVLQHGTGAINVDGCRVEYTTVGNGSLALNPHLRSHINGGNGGNIIAHETNRRVVIPTTKGRFPANLIHDGSEEVVQLFPETGKSAGGGGVKAPGKNGIYGSFNGHEYGETLGFGDTGSAARFFYCAKASKRDRNEGLLDGKISSHPTVKPTDLMRYLVRLVTPPGGVVLDPFAGSGSTGKACMYEGFAFIGCELDPNYVEIATARIEHAILDDPKQMNMFDDIDDRKGED